MRARGTWGCPCPGLEHDIPVMTVPGASSDADSLYPTAEGIGLGTLAMRSFVLADSGREEKCLSMDNAQKTGSRRNVMTKRTADRKAPGARCFPPINSLQSGWRPCFERIFTLPIPVLSDYET